MPTFSVSNTSYFTNCTHTVGSSPGDWHQQSAEDDTSNTPSGGRRKTYTPMNKRRLYNMCCLKIIESVLSTRISIGSQAWPHLQAFDGVDVGQFLAVAQCSPVRYQRRRLLNTDDPHLPFSTNRRISASVIFHWGNQTSPKDQQEDVHIDHGASLAKYFINIVR